MIRPRSWRRAFPCIDYWPRPAPSRRRTRPPWPVLSALAPAELPAAPSVISNTLLTDRGAGCRAGYRWRAAARLTCHAIGPVSAAQRPRIWPPCRCIGNVPRPMTGFAENQRGGTEAVADMMARICARLRCAVLAVAIWVSKRNGGRAVSCPAHQHRSLSLRLRELR